MKSPKFDPLWREDVVALYQHDMQEIWDNTIAIHIWNQYHNQLDQYCAFVQTNMSLEILDVGCAQGTLALRLAEEGHRVTAVDLRQEFLNYAASRYEYGKIEFIQGNVLDLELEKQFDLIFANQIVEHLVYPLEMFKVLKQRLKPEGQLVVTTPNWHYLVNALPCFSELGDPKKWENRQFTADGGGHFFAYKGEELSRIFEFAGFEKINIRYFETPWISGHMKVRYLHDLIPVSILKLLDRFLLATPFFGKRVAHQLLITGRAPK